jgi:hypothetical protein
VFSEVLVFRTPVPQGGDSILIGTRRPLRLDLLAMEGRWQDARVQQDLERIGLHRAEDLLALLYLGPDGVRDLVRGAPLNTDDNMYVEFRGARDMAGAISIEHQIFARLEQLAPAIATQLADASLLEDPERMGALVAALERVGRPVERQHALASRPDADE